MAEDLQALNFQFDQLAEQQTSLQNKLNNLPEDATPAEMMELEYELNNLKAKQDAVSSLIKAITDTKDYAAKQIG